MVEEAKGFLGRWSRRKTDALQGKPLAEPTPDLVAVPVSVVAGAAGTPASSAPVESTPALASAHSVAEESSPPEPVLSLEDVKLLTKDSDFKPFMAKSVGPEVRNAAMKKLFADPHFNVMDGLDIYIDDYSIADPIPESMLRQMTGAKFLNLFDDEKDDELAALNVVPAEQVNHLKDKVVAPEDAINSEKFTPPELLADSAASLKDHAYTDLRLQPDHAPPAEDAGRGP